MSAEALATEETKTKLENSVAWYLSDKLQDASAAIATKKYLTHDNQLVYLTRCNVAELAVPRIKVQVLRRVEGGVHETGYQLFGDHRLEKYTNEMIFGASAEAAPAADANLPVTEAEAADVMRLIDSLQTNARPTI
jgi:hypothetical protein